ncbi:MAG: CoA transferase [Alphaproteobacteria bacterium]
MTDPSSASASEPALTRGPLAGVTVLDLTRVLAGPYCTMVLADLGARVIKVERPGDGDDSRGYGPFLAGESAYFGSLNRGKESIALDLKDEADRALFERLLAEADVLVENYRPGTMERLGYGAAKLRQRFPRLVYAAVSGFGQTGPYAARPAYDMIVQAMGGIMSVTGQAGETPVRVGTSVGDITAGLFTAIGIVSALFDRARTGRGETVDVAMLDCQVAILENAIARFAATGQVPGPLGARHPSITPFEMFRAADDFLVVAAGNDQMFQTLCDLLGRRDLAGDPRFASNDARTDHQQDLKREIEKVLATRPAAEWIEACVARGIPAARINTVDKVLADPHVNARDMVATAYLANGEALTVAGNPIKLGGRMGGTRRAGVPVLDGDRSRILAGLGRAGRRSRWRRLCGQVGGKLGGKLGGWLAGYGRGRAGRP